MVICTPNPVVLKRQLLERTNEVRGGRAKLEAALAERDALVNNRDAWATRERELIQSLSDSAARADTLTAQITEILAHEEVRMKEDGAFRAALDRAKIDLARSERKRASLERQIGDLHERAAGENQMSFESGHEADF